MRIRPLGAVLLASGAAVVVLLPGVRTGAPTAGLGRGRITLTAAPVNPGQPKINDSLAGKPILTVGTGGLAVGKTLTNNVVITNQSNAPLTVTLAQQNLKTSSSKVDLSSYARLTVTDAATGRTLYTGPVSGFPANPVAVCGKSVTAKSPCPTWGAAEAHTISFSVVIPDSANVSTYEGSSLSTDYLWTSET